MTTEHTPGPWIINLRGVNDHIGAIGPIFGYNYDSLELDPDNPRDMADARLVSAAPDLLAACEDALEGFRHVPMSLEGTHEAVLTLRAAVAKATGKTA